MVEKAFSEGWITEDEQRRRLRREMEKIILNPASGNRDRIAAAKALMAGERIHLSERDLAVKEKLLGGDDDGSILALIGRIIESRHDDERPATDRGFHPE